MVLEAWDEPVALTSDPSSTGAARESTSGEGDFVARLFTWSALVATDSPLMMLGGGGGVLAPERRTAGGDIDLEIEFKNAARLFRMAAGSAALLATPSPLWPWAVFCRLGDLSMLLVRQAGRQAGRRIVNSNLGELLD